MFDEGPPDAAPDRLAAAAARRQRRFGPPANPILTEARDLGTLGDSGYRLLLEITDSVRRTRNVPPPEGLSRWDADAVADFANDWLWDADRGAARAAQMLATVETDAGLEAYLEKCIENAFASQGRATDKGARRRALRRTVGGDDRFAVAAKPWRYSKAEQASLPPFAGDPAELVAASRAVAVGPRPPWNSDIHRRPIGAADDVRSVVLAVLEAAGCPCLESPLMLEIVLDRFQVDDAAPVQQQLSDEDQELPDEPAPVSHEPELVRRASDLIWDRLPAKARSVLAAHVAGETARAIERWSGISSSTANRHTNIIDKHLAEIANEPFGSAVLVELSARSHQLAGTTVATLAFTSDVGTPT